MTDRPAVYDELIQKITEMDYADGSRVLLSGSRQAEDIAFGLVADVDLLWRLVRHFGGDVPPWMERHGAWYEGAQIEAWTSSEDHDDAPGVTPMYRSRNGRAEHR